MEPDNPTAKTDKVPTHNFIAPPPVPPKPQKGSSRGRLTAVGAVVALLLVGGMVWMAYSIGKSADDEEMAELQIRCDSLSSVAVTSQRRADNIQRALTEISTALDSVAIAEGLLLNVVDPETNRRYTAAQMRERVEQFGQVIERQKRRIQQLENITGIDGSTADASGLHRVISHLRRQLDAKEAELENMRLEVAGARRSVANMRAQVDEMTETVNQVREQNANMEQALQAQTVIINEGYVAMGTGSQLAEKGILTGGGFLRKRRLNPDAFSPSLFQAVDIAAFTEIQVNANKCKILTAMPSGSYTISGSKGSWTVTITDPTAFWSVSNYLVIQTD